MNIMNPWNRLSLQAASFILTGVSIVFTVLLWSQLPDEIWMKIVSGFAGFALELCKFSLLPLSFVLLKSKKTMSAGALLFLFGGALFVVSIGASVAFLESGEQARQQQGAVWQGRQTTLVQLDERIRIAQSAAEKDIAGGYRQRGLDTLEQVEQWQEQRQALLSEPVTESAGAVGLNESQRFYAWLLLAILIDGCAVAGWVVLSQEDQSEPQDKPEEEKIESQGDVKESETREAINHLEARLEAFLRTQEKREAENKVFLVAPEVKQVVKDDIQKPEAPVTESIKETVTTKETEETVTTNTKTKLMVVERELLERITSGEHGGLFSIRELMRKEKIGHAKAKQIVDSLEDDGVLIDTGKGYQLARVDENQQVLNV